MAEGVLKSLKSQNCKAEKVSSFHQKEVPPPPRISYANVHNYYGPYAYCSLDKRAVCAQHIQLPTHTRAQATCAEIGNPGPMGCIRQKKILVQQQGATCAEIGKCTDKPMFYVAALPFVRNEIAYRIITVPTPTAAWTRA